MLPFPRRACQPFLMGKALHKQLSPATRPKSGAPALKRFCPAGANSVDPRTPAAYPCPAGQGCVISPNLPFRARDKCAQTTHTSMPEACSPQRPAATSNKKRRKPLPCREKRDTGAGAMPDMVGFSENGNAAIVAFCSTQITKRCRRQAPARGAGARLHGAEGAGCRHCRLGLRARVAPCSCGARSRRASVENAVLPLVLSYCTLFCHFSRRKNMQWRCGCIPFCALARKERPDRRGK